jgi:hypothetical protein
MNAGVVQDLRQAIEGERALACRLPDGRAACLSLTATATAVAVADENVSCYDLAGRPYVLVRDGGTYRRALDGRWLEKRPAAGTDARVRRMLSTEEGVAIAEAARRDVEAVWAALAGSAGVIAEGRLRGIAAMDPGSLRADAARFASLYRPVGVLPPDQYLALVVQLTEGCSWGACTFCDLYRGTRFRVKTVEEVRAHAAGIRAYFGESLALRRSLFLGDANALCLSDERLMSLVETATAAFPELAARGVAAFVDLVSGPRREARQYAALAGAGLRRVYIGLETGDAALLSWLDKPGTPEDAVELVDALHATGIGAGVIVLVGAGGRRFAEGHVRGTAEALTRMRLTPRDIVYFSEIVEHPGLEYARRMERDGIVALDAAELGEQRRAIAAGWRPADVTRPPRQVRYDIREFLY